MPAPTAVNVSCMRLGPPRRPSSPRGDHVWRSWLRGSQPAGRPAAGRQRAIGRPPCSSLSSALRLHSNGQAAVLATVWLAVCFPVATCSCLDLDEWLIDSLAVLHGTIVFSFFPVLPTSKGVPPTELWDLSVWSSPPIVTTWALILRSGCAPTQPALFVSVRATVALTLTTCPGHLRNSVGVGPGAGAFAYPRLPAALADTVVVMRTLSGSCRKLACPRCCRLTTRWCPWISYLPAAPSCRPLCRFGACLDGACCAGPRAV